MTCRKEDRIRFWNPTSAEPREVKVCINGETRTVRAEKH